MTKEEEPEIFLPEEEAAEPAAEPAEPASPARPHLALDVREAKVAAALDELGVPYAREALPMGDARVSFGDDAWFFERKTVADVRASLRDGRYAEQKARLLAHAAPGRITYLIEGLTATPWNLPDDPANAGLQGVVYYTLYRDGIHVFPTQHPRDTARFLATFLVKLERKPFGGAVGTAASAAASAPASAAYVATRCLKARRIDNVDPGACWRMMLSQVPGLSSKLAEHVASRWPTLSSLAEALRAEETPAARLALLRTVPLLGPKKAETVLRFLGYAEGG